MACIKYNLKPAIDCILILEGRGQILVKSRAIVRALMLIKLIKKCKGKRSIANENDLFVKAQATKVLPLKFVHITNSSF